MSFDEVRLNDLRINLEKVLARYQGEMTTQEMLRFLTSYICEMAIYCAPSLDEAKKIIKAGIRYQFNVAKKRKTK
jgi:hypothetical protein